MKSSLNPKKKNFVKDKNSDITDNVKSNDKTE